MKNLFSLIRSWFSTSKQTEAEMRLQQLEHDVNRLNKMLSMHEVSITVSDALNVHLSDIISKSVTAWADDKYAVKDDIETVVSDAIDEHDFSDSISNALDDAISNRDWDYELRDAVDWDRFAEKVSDKLDWSTIISDNEIICQGDYDFDDFMLKSEHMSEDDLVTRDDLSDMVIGELKRDWFEQKMKDEVTRHFKDTLQSVRQTEEDNCRNAIDDAIEAKLDLLLVEQMKSKFGPQFDIWFHNLVAHAVQTVMGEMVKAAYEQVINDTKETNQ